jgi:hypothetical protein
MSPHHPGTADPEDKGARVHPILGFAFHALLASAGTLAFGLLLGYLIGAVRPGLLKNREIVAFIAASALLALFATPRRCSRSAPWVGVLALIAFGTGAQELARTWSPAWSHQTRMDFVLSQLFCINEGCSDSEGLYALLFGWPCLCFGAYSLASLFALPLAKDQNLNEC